MFHCFPTHQPEELIKWLNQGKRQCSVTVPRMHWLPHEHCLSIPLPLSMPFSMPGTSFPCLEHLKSSRFKTHLICHLLHPLAVIPPGLPCLCFHIHLHMYLLKHPTCIILSYVYLPSQTKKSSMAKNTPNHLGTPSIQHGTRYTSEEEKSQVL